MNEKQRSESFTLSMVDLFGCGFIAAIFLFVLNVLQPQLEAARSEAASSRAGRADGATRSGPVFVSIKSHIQLAITGWPTKRDPPSPSLRPRSLPDDQFQYSYDQVLPNAAALAWPLRVKFCAKPANPAAKCAEAAAVAAPFDVVVRVTVGNATTTAYFIAERGGDEIDVSFAFEKALYAKTTRPYKNAIALDLTPRRESNRSYHSTASFYSDAHFMAAAGWAGGVDRILVLRKNAPSVVTIAPSSIANCWIFADSNADRDTVRCPTNPAELLNSVSNDPWRSEVFAQRADTCAFPFKPYLCQFGPPGAEAAAAPAPTSDRCTGIGWAFLCQAVVRRPAQ